MFLDPEPRNTRRPRSQTEFQGYIPPLTSPKDQRIIRKPLQQRSPNHSLPVSEQYEDLHKPTVRLIKQTPSVATLRKEVFGELGDKVSLAPFKGKERGLGVTGLQSPPTSEVGDVDSPIDDSLQTATSEDLPSWKDRSISSSNFSNATTLRGSEGPGTYARSDRIISGTTARESSVLHDTSLRDLPESGEEAGTLDDTDYSATTYEYEESVAEQRTIKPVLASIKSYETEIAPAETPRPRSRRQTWSSTDSERGSSPPVNFLAGPDIPPRISSKLQRASLDVSSSPWESPVASSSSPPQQLEESPYLPPDGTTSAASLAQSEASVGNFQAFPSSPNLDAYPSSPNFIAYDSSPTRPRSRSHPLRGEHSYESISSRLRAGELSKYPALAQQTSWNSVDPASSVDTLPSLHVPRRRLRQARGSHSLDIDQRMQDLQQQGHSFSGNLSTIASESERSRSRTASQQLGNAQRPSEAWSSHLISRADSAAFDEPGDMTLGLYREQSAMPEPLFRPPSTEPRLQQRQAYVLPPLPPMPYDFEESHDTLAELGYATIRLKRSGYSLKKQRSSGSLHRQQSNNSLYRPQSSTSLRHQRSHSTPIHSRQLSIASESDRWSSSSNIFPLWVRLYYSGSAALASMSQVSITPIPTPSIPARDGAQNGMRFDRFPSQRFQRSLTASSSPVSTQDATPSSPAPKRFPSSRFRPRDISRRISRTIESVVRPENDKSSRNSMAIEPVEALAAPSNDRNAKRSPRKQRMNGPSMNKPLPQMPDAEQRHFEPHLAATKRESAHLNTWRPPSFVESIDRIFKSRGHRQILFFLAGFVFPFAWMIGALWPLPARPANFFDVEKGAQTEHAEQSHPTNIAASENVVLWREEQAWRQGVWWRNVNRLMSILGLLVIAAVIAIAVISTQ